ncbi:MAG: hypothetical protein GX424_11470 [Clostridiales bacterium]|nr:hypothetical protein [Clostridiales bacterium]
MKEFTANGHFIRVGTVKKTLAFWGDSNCETVCFTIGRQCGDADLSQCVCTVKTRNSNGKADVILPRVETGDDTVRVVWTVSSASTSVSGALQVQIQFEKIFDDNTKNLVWQSNVMEFDIPQSLDAADEVYDQDPTLFQQWEDRVNTAYSSVSASLTAAQAAAAQAGAAAVKTPVIGESGNWMTVQPDGSYADSGVKAQGAPGTAATVAVGSVTLLPENTGPTVANSGTAAAAVLDFGLPAAPALRSWNLLLNPRNLFENPCFAFDTSGWALGTPGVERDPGVTMDGCVSVRNIQSGLSADAYRGINSQRYPVAEGKTYTVCWYMMTDDPASLAGSSGYFGALRGATAPTGGSVNYPGIIGGSNGTSNWITPDDFAAAGAGNWFRVFRTVTISGGYPYLYLYTWLPRNGRVWFAKPALFQDSATEPFDLADLCRQGTG